MIVTRMCKVFVSVILSFALLSCRSHHNKAGVEAAMKQYDRLIQKFDADSIALLYTPDGKMGEMATGRDSIVALLKSLTNIKVLLQHSTSDTVTIIEDTAIQKGNYVQTDEIISRGKMVVEGEYTATWQWMENGWHIKKIETKPLDMKIQ